MWNSTNPALANDDAFNQFYGKAMFDERSNIATVQGVVNKTAILTGLAIAAGVGGYALVIQVPASLLIANIAALVVALAIGFKVCANPKSAIYLGPVYAIVEGVFLGALTGAVEKMLLSRGIRVPGGVALQAFIITGSCLGAMLVLYKARILRPSRMLTAFLGTVTGAVMLCYLLSWPLAFFGIDLPFIGWGAAFNSTGSAAWIGLGLNAFILLIASMWLINDFGMIEERLSSAQPKYMEWYCGFALLVTLAWIYYESVKMVARIASIVDRR